MSTILTKSLMRNQVHLHNLCGKTAKRSVLVLPERLMDTFTQLQIITHPVIMLDYLNKMFLKLNKKGNFIEKKNFFDPFILNKLLKKN